MSNSYVNKYVIQVETGHGNTNYKIISTREGFTELAHTLNAKLEKPEQSLRNQWHGKILLFFFGVILQLLLKDKRRKFIYLSSSMKI